ncbi:MAG TPA: MBOAT family O-acyltransferase [Beijerinckiaceae bacterium]|nr:MBOAT family O-acyltransferase [Beijerinckiaceae bacterium]
MLFNSFAFLLVFLPLSLAAHWAAERYAPAWRLAVLALLSFAFYAYWDWRLLPLMLISIGVNWLIARMYGATQRGMLVTLAIVVNLLVLCVFKYAGFFVDTANTLGGFSWARPEIILPLGISFFTFHHIMYLVDLRAGKAPQFNLTQYALYIAFFPQVLAGPLVRWSEIMHQFDQRPFREGYFDRAAQGLMLLVFGLMKKVFLGDPLSEYANPIFADAAAGKTIAFAQAVQAVLAFTFQIYFDFSGYTDMAIGIGLMFGVLLPLNFNSPYVATSLQDFWRRWHMTLSRFLRDYLYIAMGGNRLGLAIQLFALFATMALGGLWHGAGWTFVAWGVAHGVGLGIGVLWRKNGWPMPTFLGWLATFIFVMLCWVLFRAQTFDAAMAIYQGLLGYNGLGSGFKWRMLAVAAVIAIVGPTSFALSEKLRPAPWLAVLLAVVFVAVLLKIGDDANYEFIYFQF